MLLFICNLSKLNIQLKKYNRFSNILFKHVYNGVVSSTQSSHTTYGVQMMLLSQSIQWLRDFKSSTSLLRSTKSWENGTWQWGLTLDQKNARLKLKMLWLRCSTWSMRKGPEVRSQPNCLTTILNEVNCVFKIYVISVSRVSHFKICILSLSNKIQALKFMI